MAKENWSAISLAEQDFYSQNTITGSVGKRDPNFADGGWYKARDLYDFSNIEVPMRSLFLKSDPICKADLNKPILETIPSHGVSLEVFNFDVKVPTDPHHSMVGRNDPIFRGVREGLLNFNAGEDVAGDCSTIDFSVWN